MGFLPIGERWSPLETKPLFSSFFLSFVLRGQCKGFAFPATDLGFVQREGSTVYNHVRRVLSGRLEGEVVGDGCWVSGARI